MQEEIEDCPETVIVSLAALEVGPGLRVPGHLRPPGD